MLQAGDIQVEEYKQDMYICCAEIALHTIYQLTAMFTSSKLLKFNCKELLLAPLAPFRPATNSTATLYSDGLFLLFKIDSTGQTKLDDHHGWSTTSQSQVSLAIHSSNSSN
jgi:hypothetical protein